MRSNLTIKAVLKKYLKGFIRTFRICLKQVFILLIYPIFHLTLLFIMVNLFQLNKK